jgi:CDP-ribitol ribitolphosphotransferase
MLRKENNNKFVFALYRSTKLEGNLKFIYDEVRNQFPNAEIHLVSGTNKMNLKLFKEVIFLSNARYLILDDYYLPVYLIKPDKRLKIVQLWHAAGAFKKFGHSTTGTKFGPSRDYLRLVPIHSNYTHVYVSSEKVIKYYADAFNMNPKRIIPIGVPRIDLFSQTDLCNEIKSCLFTDYPMLNNGQVNILIAPTYRADGSQKESSLDLIGSIINMSNLIHNKYIIFKAHPYMNRQELRRLEKCPNVLIASDKYAINEWMLVSDAFVTDYSSSVFEFALLNRPMAHFIPDYNDYKNNRGLYQEVAVVSDGIVLTDTHQLSDWINKREHNEYFDASRMIKYNFDQTQNISKKIYTHFTSC